jgi:hypothetical protein
MRLLLFRVQPDFQRSAQLNPRSCESELSAGLESRSNKATPAGLLNSTIQDKSNLIQKFGSLKELLQMEAIGTSRESTKTSGFSLRLVARPTLVPSTLSTSEAHRLL